MRVLGFVTCVLLIVGGLACLLFYQSDELGLIDAQAENMRAQLAGFSMILMGVGVLFVYFVLNRRSGSK
jgi:hypothetical protein